MTESVDGAFNMPWGTEVVVRRCPANLFGMVCFRGVLRKPVPAMGWNEPMVAVFDVGGVMWGISNEQDWEFDPVDQPGAEAPVAPKTEWTEFAARCREQVRLIVQNKDDGLYAKLYAADVDRLLRMLSRIDEERIHPSAAFQVTRH